MPPKKKAPKRVPTEKDILDALQKAHDANSWAFMRQVRENTGAAVGRYADAVAMGLWPSRGMELHGFEVKVSRSDWLRELKEPEKAEAVASRCDRWWMVTPVDVIEDGELPPKWGHWLWKNDELELVKKGDLLEGAGKDLDRTFVASLLRRAVQDMLSRGDTDIESEVKRRMDGRERQMVKDYQRLVEDTRRAQTQDLAQIRETIARFEEESGVRIEKYTAGRIGQAVKVVIEGGLQTKIQQLRQIQNTHESAANLIGSVLQEVGE